MSTRLISCLIAIAWASGCDVSPPLGKAESSLAASALPATGFGDPGVTSSPPPAGWPAGSQSWCCAGAWWTPIQANVGDVIASITAQVQDVAPAPTYIPGSVGDGGSQVRLELVAQVGTATTVLGAIVSDEAGTARKLTVSLANPYTVPVGASLFARATAIAVFPSSVMHPSTIGPLAVAAPLSVAPTIIRSRPAWLQQGPFVISQNPTPGAGNAPVWRSAGIVPANASFEVPFTAGDTIVGLGWDAYGDGGSGIGSIDIFYQSAMGATITQIGSSFDQMRAPGWGHVRQALTPQHLEPGGIIWVSLEVDADDYYIGLITAEFSH